jgi:hypothetical protein
VSVAAAVPVFLIVISCAAVVAPTVVDAKVRLAGVNETVTPEAAVEVPVSVTVCGPPVALSATDRVDESAPVGTGLNSIEIVQLELTARVVPHVVADLTKEPLLPPANVSEVSVTAAVPEFVTVTF